MKLKILFCKIKKQIKTFANWKKFLNSLEMLKRKICKKRKKIIESSSWSTLGPGRRWEKVIWRVNLMKERLDRKKEHCPYRSKDKKEEAKNSGRLYVATLLIDAGQLCASIVHATSQKSLSSPFPQTIISCPSFPLSCFQFVSFIIRRFSFFSTTQVLPHLSALNPFCWRAQH